MAIPWHCPRCKGPLSSTPAPSRCAACALSFPTCGEIPILTRDPLALLAAEAARIGAQREGIREQLARLAVSETDGRLAFRAAPFAARREGLARNDRLAAARLQDLLGALAALGGPRAPFEGPLPARAGAGDPLQYLHADWGPSSSNGDAFRVRQVVEELVAQRPRGPRARALVLGCGAGRQAAELTSRFDEVLAIDLEHEPLWLCERALRSPIEFALLQDVSPLDSPGLTFLSRTIEAQRPKGLHLAVADAAQLPLADASVSHVVSVYSIDIQPLPVLLGEARRVLQPGGVFLHLGPLHYRDDDIAWHAAPDELPQAFAALGFQLDPVTEHRFPFHRTPGCGLEISYACYAFEAKRLD